MSSRAAIPRPAKPLRILIADDEPVARRVLRQELELRPDVEILGEADTGVRTLAAIEDGRPDLVLLDLEMPQMGGFEVISRLRGGGHLPVIVVVTAYDQYAIRAFEEGAIDYLLKPVSEARLARALERARQLVGTRSEAAEALAHLQEIAGASLANQATPDSRPRKIVGRAGDEYFLLNTNEVLAFQAEGELVWIVTARRRYLATQSLKAIEQKLQGGSFRRVHRNALVNVDHVRKMAALSSNRWLITLDNNQEFIVSKRLARNVRQILSW
jgi:two-component system, LytTR family, response regulator